MEYRQPPRRLWPVAAGTVAILIVFVGLVGPCSSGPDVNEELARTVRIAVEAADDARRSNDRAYLLPGRLRLVVIVIGVAVPIVVAAALVYLVTRRRPGDLEVEVALRKYRRLLDCDHAISLPGPEQSQQIESNTAGTALPAETSQASSPESTEIVSAE